jgi:hypothetical protein
MRPSGKGFVRHTFTMTQPNGAFRLVHPVTDDALRRAAALRLARTRRSLDWLLRRDAEGVALFGEARGDQMIVAVEVATGQPVGIVTWQRDGRDVFRTRPHEFGAVYGPVGGRLRLWTYHLLRCLAAPGRTPYVNTLWVEPGWRPRGAGIALMRATTATLTGRFLADIRRDDRRMTLLLHRLGLRPAVPSVHTVVLRAFGYRRMERPAAPLRR